MDEIVKPLEKLYKIYRKGKNVSEYTKSAQSITREWQKKFVKEVKIEAEVPICRNAKEKIDVVDFRTKTAYELKVSGKNVEHEFYKDIFKIITFNNNNPEKKLTTFVFISEKKGIDKLECSSLYKETKKYFEYNNYTLNIRLEAININVK